MIEATDRRPLAERLRPKTLAAFIGQRHLLSPQQPLSLAIERRVLHSMIFWGPPGVGKTSLAQLLAHGADQQLVSLPAVSIGLKDLRTAVDAAAGSVLLIDEIHRLNKPQQDVLLPALEQGQVTLIGATTENPSFALSNALLSRCVVYLLHPLADDEAQQLLERACQVSNCQLSEDAQQALIAFADGDGRKLINQIEQLAQASEGLIELDTLKKALPQATLRFDANDFFYDQISALHKAVRGSDPDAALYWFCRMVAAGTDLLYLARRMLRMAWEDIGLADPRAARIALDATQTYQQLGSPEGELALASAVIYLACAPKSNATDQAYQQALTWVKNHGSTEVPLHLRNAPTRLMKNLGYSQGYRYPHDEPDAFAAGQRYWPDSVPAQQWYRPTARGLESQIRTKLDDLKQRQQAAQSKPTPSGSSPRSKPTPP